MREFFTFFNNSEALTIDVKRAVVVGSEGLQWITPYLAAKLYDGRHEDAGPTKVAINEALTG